MTQETTKASEIVTKIWIKVKTLTLSQKSMVFSSINGEAGQIE